MYPFFYRALILLCTPLAVLIFIARGRTRSNLQQRFGGWDLPPGELIWFHGASVGEVNGLRPLMQRVRSNYPTLKILLTSTTATGLERGKAAADMLRLLPIDHPWFLRRALRGVSVRCFVYGETELWPSLLAELVSRRVSIALVNARMSDRTFPLYAQFRNLFAPLLAAHAVVAAADDESRARFTCLGAPAERTVSCGNAKYDVRPSVTTVEERERLRRSFFGSSTAPVLVLASIRPGEEAWWFDAAAAVYRRGAQLSMIVAPRHQEKVAAIAEALSARGLPFVRRSEHVAQCPAGASIVLLDLMGALEPTFSFADLVFVGASLVNIGGHNPLEPAMYGAPVSMGPHTQNVRGLVGAMEQAQAFHLVRTPADVQGLVEQLIVRSPELRESGARGTSVWREQVGAADRVFRTIEPLLRSSEQLLQQGAA